MTEEEQKCLLEMPQLWMKIQIHAWYHQLMEKTVRGEDDARYRGTLL